MIRLALHNLLRRRLRTALTLSGIAAAMAMLACLLAFGEGYQRGLSRELDSMGLQMMLVPLGCPYDAAARVLKGKTLDVSLPANSVEVARHDPAVAVAAPLLLATVPRPSEGRTDLWVGIDDSIRPLKPWWKFVAGSRWFADDNEVILGAEAAATEMRRVGDTFYSPETNRRFRVCGILQRSGTSDDSQFFVPLRTAQAMFRQPGRVTAVAIRLRDPALLGEAAPRLQEIPGAQVATMTEMMGTFLNLIGAVRTLVLAVALVALTISALAVFTTMLSSVLERTGELAVLRAVGASRLHLFGLLTLESLLLTVCGCLGGLLLALLGGQAIETIIDRWVSLVPTSALLTITGNVMARCFTVATVMGLLAGLYPAWKASRLHPAQALRMD
jgi:putative ABC transport system permease protein